MLNYTAEVFDVIVGSTPRLNDGRRSSRTSYQIVGDTHRFLWPLRPWFLLMSAPITSMANPATMTMTGSMPHRVSAPADIADAAR